MLVEGIIIPLLLLGLLLQILEQSTASFRRAGIRYTRFKGGLFLSGAFFGYLLLIQSPHPMPWALTAVTFGPLPITVANCCLGRPRWPFRSAACLLIGGFLIAMTLFQLLVFGFDPFLFLLLNGWWICIPFILILPLDPAFPEEPDKRMRLGLCYVLYPMAGIVILWVALSQWIYFQSTRLAAPEQNCVMETDGTKTRWSLTLSPRKMFFGNADDGLTLPRLRASDSNGSFYNHWSFRHMSFVHDESTAFWGGPSYYKANQPRDPCP